jgi:predicted metal-dependent peptidase
MQAISHEDRISKAKIALYRTFPFFSFLVENMSISADKDKVPTMGVNNLSQCFYNPDFLKTLSNDEVMGVLCHEVMHLAYNHPERGQHRRIMVGNISLWNIAIDLVVNQVLVVNNIKLPDKGLIPSNNGYEFAGYQIDDISEKSGEDIYEELKKYFQQMSKQKQKGQGGKGKGQGNSDGKGNQKGQGGITVTVPEDEKTGFDEHSFEEKGEGQEGEGSSSGNGKEKGELKEGKGSGSIPSDKKEEKDWSKITATAYNYAKQRGTEPAGMGREFQVYNKSYINWRAYLRKEISKRVPKDYCWSKPSKKYLSQNIYLPHVKGESVKVLFSIDTSGSISGEELSKFVTEILAVARSFSDIEFRVLTHDAEVHDDYYIANGNVNKIKAMNLHGGGGTDHNPLYNFIKNKGYNKVNDILFSFTDGYSSYPDRPNIDTIFILAGQYDKSAIPKWNKGIVELR